MEKYQRTDPHVEERKSIQNKNYGICARYFSLLKPKYRSIGHNKYRYFFNFVSDSREDQFAVICSIPSSASRQNCIHASFILINKRRIKNKQQTNLLQVVNTPFRIKKLEVHSSTRQVKTAASLVNDDDDDDDHYNTAADDDDSDGVNEGKKSTQAKKTTRNRTFIPAEVTKYTREYLRQMLLPGQQAVHDNSKEDPIVTLELWDFAGQHLYYASHPVFFSPRGVYVLVHNLSKPLDALAEPCVRQGVHDIFLENPNGETNMENLLSWLVTVHGSRPTSGELVGSTEKEDLTYLRPPVIIVGTHADKPFKSDINEITSQIQREISGKEYEKHVIRPFFNVDNTKGNKSMVRRMREFLGKRLKRGPQAGIVLECTGRVTMRQ